MVDDPQDVKAWERANSTGSTNAGEADCTAKNALYITGIQHLFMENDYPVDEDLGLGNAFPLV